MIPVYGRDLINKYFRTEQIIYHVFVIKGYDDESQEFITQEPATRFGLDYRYKYDIVMNAMHDFRPNDTQNGRKVAVFTRKEIITSGNTDGDSDGLTKSEELKHKTILWLDDSDGDGYSDREEVIHGYSPILNEVGFKNGTIIKSPTSPHIYMIERHMKRKIRSMRVMRNHGWTMKDVVEVSQKFIDFKLKEGKMLNE
ncbi:hypothetical protein HOF40_02150 [Candidatus Parcubacteria bacterium]|jgi:hypothetical protein|nr:hypothetical protein [Candidatus Parcubacteria bacterium]MBT3948866.1 hypothetical protein [Candidatus Parcubacteria bacterium]